MEKGLGMPGLAIVVNHSQIDMQAENKDKVNHLPILKPTNTFPVSYWAGFAWDRAGLITTAAAWGNYVNEFAEARRSPIALSVK